VKRVQAVIRPDRLDEVQAALSQAGFGGFMVHDIRGHGTEGTPSGEWRGVAYSMAVRHKLLVDVLVDDEEVAACTAAIKAAASTGQPGDGLIFVVNVEAVIPLH